MANLFDNFSKNDSLEVAQLIINDYNEHYLKFIDDYEKVIKSTHKILEEYRQEQKDFYKEELPQISETLKERVVDDDMQKEWLTHLEQSMQRSFQLSEGFVVGYMEKNKEVLDSVTSFRKELDRKLVDIYGVEIERENNK